MIVCPGESLLVYLKVHTHAPLIRRFPEGGAGGRAESHPACIDRRRLCRKNSPLAGLDAPTPAREKGLPSLWGALLFQGGEPKVSKGRAESPLRAPAGAYFHAPWWGLTRRLRRGLGLAVPRGAHTFLSVAKEKCAKESQRHGDSGKKPFIAHFGGGARYVARSMSWPAYAYHRARSELAFFRRQNGRAFFPPLPIAALLRRSRRGAGLPLAGWDASCSWNFAA